MKLPFTTFAERLGLTLTRGQLVLARIAFDGIEPGQLEGDERELARDLVGDVDTVPEAARRRLVLVLGRGSGKTTVASAYALWRMLTADVSKAGPGDVPTVVVVAPRTQTAKLSIRMALEMARRDTSLSKLLQGESAEGFTLRRHDGRLVSFAAFAASRGGAAARGISVLDAILDEAWFFQSDTEGAYAVNDRDVYRALVPRLMAGGKVVFISTPWPVETLMGELFGHNFGSPTTALAAKAPTLLMRDGDPELAELIEVERAADPENAAREFDCETTFSSTKGFFTPGSVQAAVDDSMYFPAAPKQGARHVAAVDLAFKSDSSTLAIIRREPGLLPTHPPSHRLVLLEELRPRPDAPLKPSEVVATFARHLREYAVREVWSDGHYVESARELFAAAGVTLKAGPEGHTGKVEQYTRARLLFHEGSVQIPRHSRLITQLGSIVSKPLPGGSLQISAPRRSGQAHADLVSALVLALWASKKKDPPRGMLQFPAF